MIKTKTYDVLFSHSTRTGWGEEMEHKDGKKRRMLLLTVLAAGSVESRRTVAKLGGSLSTLAPIEAHAVATHSYMWSCR